MEDLSTVSQLVIVYVIQQTEVTSEGKMTIVYCKKGLISEETEK